MYIYIYIYANISQRLPIYCPIFNMFSNRFRLLYLVLIVFAMCSYIFPNVVSYFPIYCPICIPTCSCICLCVCYIFLWNFRYFHICFNISRFKEHSVIIVIGIPYGAFFGGTIGGAAVEQGSRCLGS